MVALQPGIEVLGEGLARDPELAALGAGLHPRAELGGRARATEPALLTLAVELARGRVSLEKSPPWGASLERVRAGDARGLPVSVGDHALSLSSGRATFPNTCSRHRVQRGHASKEWTDGSDQTSAGDL